jgi:hypothetical protein
VLTMCSEARGTVTGLVATIGRELLERSQGQQTQVPTCQAEARQEGVKRRSDPAAKLGEDASMGGSKGIS